MTTTQIDRVELASAEDNLVEPELELEEDADSEEGSEYENTNASIKNTTVDMDDAFHIEFDDSQWLPCIPRLSLSLATVIGAFLGIVIGLSISLTDSTVSDDWEDIIGFPGKMWISGLKLLVLPLICLMMVVLPAGVQNIGGISKYCVPLYLFTSFCAAVQGSAWGWIIRPGSHGDIWDDTTDTSTSSEVSELDAVLNAIELAIPDNIVGAFYDMNILGCLVFFLTIGILLRNAEEEQRNVVLNFSKAILKCCLIAIVWLVWFTPIGMMSLVTVKVATTEDLPGLAKALGFYIVTVLVGHFVHVFIFYPILFWFTTRSNAYSFMYSIHQVPMLAFATSSSAATLPRSLHVAEQVGIRREIFLFTLPLGSCINMDGTALGFPIMIALISQLHGVDQSFGTIVLIAILSMFISVGTAPIPNAGMVYLLMLLEAANLEDYQTDAIATLFVLDWFVDRIETAVNVTSDQFISKMVDELDKRENHDQVDGC